MVSHPWRYRCPEGHAAIWMGATTFRCRTCEQSWDKDQLRDLVDDRTRV